MDYINDLYELRDIIADEAHTAKEKIKAAGGMSGGDYDIVDKITHTMKSLDCCIEKQEENGDGYSGRMYPDGMGGSYRGYSRENRGYSRENRDSYSSARGRMNARRDSMGRYSGADGDVEDIKRDVMELAEKVKQM